MTGRGILALLLLVTSWGCGQARPEPIPGDDDDDSSVTDDDDSSVTDDDDSSVTDDDDDDDTPDPDFDGDGLTNVFEKEIGTDPANEDSDGDGFNDGDEYLNYYLPLDPDDFPYTGGYPRGPFDEDFVGDGFDQGQISGTWSHLDQYGEELHLHRFLGNVVLIYIDYEDAPPAGHRAADAQLAYDLYRDDGFVVLNFLTNGLWGPNGYSQPFAQRYIEEHGLTFPVFQHPAPHAISNNYHFAPFVPHWSLLDRELRIRAISLSGYNEWPEVLEGIEELLTEVGPTVDWPLPD